MNNTTGINLKEVELQLIELRSSVVFSHVERLVRFLHYIVKVEMNNEGERITQMSIAIDVLGRDKTSIPLLILLYVWKQVDCDPS